MNTQITQNEDGYNVDGLIVPHVTTIIGECGFFSRFYTKGSAKRGTTIHTLISDYLTDQVDYDLAGTEGIAILEKVQRFIDKYKFKVMDVEKIYASKVFGYGGRIDVIFVDQAGNEFIVDWKSGARAIWHPIQIAAYMELSGITAGGIVYLKDDELEIVTLNLHECLQVYHDCYHIYSYKHHKEASK